VVDAVVGVLHRVSWREAVERAVGEGVSVLVSEDCFFLVSLLVGG